MSTARSLTAEACAELVGRLEKATGPDRELDAQIYCAKNGYGFVKFERWNQHAGRLFYSIPGMELHCGSEGFPLYTRSIDSALTLVPEGWAWFVERIEGYSEGRARLWIPSKRTLGLKIEQVDFEAATPAIAICISALKAIAAQGE